MIFHLCLRTSGIETYNQLAGPSPYIYLCVRACVCMCVFKYHDQLIWSVLLYFYINLINYWNTTHFVISISILGAISNSMSYEARKFNATFTRALWGVSIKAINTMFATKFLIRKFSPLFILNLLYPTKSKKKKIL